MTKSSESKDNHAWCASLVEAPRQQVSGGVGEAARIVFSFMPTSAAAELVFSMLNAMFGDQATTAFADYI